MTIKSKKMEKKSLTWSELKNRGNEQITQLRKMGVCNQPSIKKIGGVEYLLIACVNIDNDYQEKIRKFDAYAYDAREYGLFVRIIKIAGASHATMSLYIRPRNLTNEGALRYVDRALKNIMQ